MALPQTHEQIKKERDLLLSSVNSLKKVDATSKARLASLIRSNKLLSVERDKSAVLLFERNDARDMAEKLDAELGEVASELLAAQQKVELYEKRDENIQPLKIELHKLKAAHADLQTKAGRLAEDTLAYRGKGLIARLLWALKGGAP